ncbi:MAG: hypothetical protein A3F12_00395 [Gammaproteobacteria bacterium RIFCSPHIGHO2_12_FULL_38_14]|nr:MAG: hypothetical protein A3F12_00395 [Gammaproteobacteria bacterium RIFCSPHIGHO2_12_FULL_38_14]
MNSPIRVVDIEEGRVKNINITISDILRAESINDSKITKRLALDGPDGGLGRSYREPNKYFSDDLSTIFSDKSLSDEKRAEKLYQLAKLYESGVSKESGKALDADEGKKCICLALAAKLGHKKAQKELLSENSGVLTDDTKNEVAKRYPPPYEQQLCLMVSDDDVSKRESFALRNKFSEKYHKKPEETVISAVGQNTSLGATGRAEENKTQFNGDLRIYLIGHGSPGADSLVGENSEKRKTVTEVADDIQKRLSGFDFSKHRVHISILACNGGNPGAKEASFAQKLAEELHKRGLPVEVSGRTDKVQYSVTQGKLAASSFTQSKHVVDYNKENIDLMRKQLAKKEEELQTIKNEIVELSKDFKKNGIKINEKIKTCNVLQDHINALTENISAAENKKKDKQRDKSTQETIKKQGKMTFFSEGVGAAKKTTVVQSYSESGKKRREAAHEEQKDHEKPKFR